MPDKVVNGFNPMLNDIRNNLIRVFCVLTSFFFPHDFKSYSILFHSLEVHLMYSYNYNNHFSLLLPRPTRCQHTTSLSLSLLCSQNIENTDVIPVYCKVLIHDESMYLTSNYIRLPIRFEKQCIACN